VRVLGLSVAVLTIAVSLPAQTMQQVEGLWKAHRYQDANDAFEALAARNPNNVDYHVHWGRMLLDRAYFKEAGEQFQKALEMKKDYPPALLGLALGFAGDFDQRAAQLAKKALEGDPKLVEAQELLARMALEDNNNAKAIEEAHKALAIDPNSVQVKAILATIDWLADKKETPWDPHTGKGYETIAYFFVINRRY